MEARQAVARRETGETKIHLSLNLDGSGRGAVATGVGFLDHMLELLAYHSGIDLEIQAEGDLHVDQHHVVEDVGLALGRATAEALGERRGIRRYGWALIPMDEVLAAAAVDLGGRPAFVTDYRPEWAQVGTFPTELVSHFCRSWANEARAALHLRLLTPGENEHHRVEAMFKAWAYALGAAVTRRVERVQQIPSTKGSL
ncbi:MAG TPA: imidazoleglycerol-phosphate dehydratase HisB [Acidobacteriota bacterium]|jgi:imidazoleglycerol phosphate dehydratase HisB|nr:imidazoleglycerol-phosphate dehydratase HisB [Acidobacteriota bacterium]HRR27157.1 imidazoleglycerol-phosphate dehydratase HisB [Acidobacteriota bacterium]HRV09601.1 imidazoleglycerol-phosphate dehydratase HisB [Acidobacteriota bacterium]